MDEYTRSTMNWLDRRYAKTTPAGVYLAHQPIYGIDDRNSEPNVVERYIRSYQILRALTHLQVQSVLDVGAAEGYQASLARDLLGLTVTCCDLSAEACKRAREIYGLRAFQADVRSLSFKDGEFDAVTCSETLEHVKDLPTAVTELLRVARKAVIITVPHETPEEVEQNRKAGELHAHINAFDLNSFDRLSESGVVVIASRHHSARLYRPARLIERWRTAGSVLSTIAKGLSILTISADPLVIRMHGSCACIRYVLLKDTAAYSSHPQKPISLVKVIARRVPYHYPQGE